MAIDADLLDETVSAPTDNVFADLGIPNPEARKLWVRLGIAVRDAIEVSGLTKVQVAERLGVDRTTVDDLARLKLRGTSGDELLTFLTKLDYDLVLTIKDKPASRISGRITVVVD